MSAAQSCLTLCDPTDCSPPGFSVHGLLQVRILEWVAMPSSRGSSCPRHQAQASHTAGRLFPPSHQGSQSSGDTVAKAERVDCATAGAQARVHFHLLRCFLERTSAKSVPDDGEGSPQK